MTTTNNMTVSELIEDLKRYDPNHYINFYVGNTYWDGYYHKLSHHKGSIYVTFRLDGYWEKSEDD